MNETNGYGITFDPRSKTGTIWYDQLYHKIPVNHGQLAIHLNKYGVVSDVQNRLIYNISAPTVPKISSDNVIDMLQKKYARDDIPEPQLCIFDNKLVWRDNISIPTFKEVMIDSQNGEIVLERSNVRSVKSGRIFK